MVGVRVMEAGELPGLQHMDWEPASAVRSSQLANEAMAGFELVVLVSSGVVHVRRPQVFAENGVGPSRSCPCWP